MSAQEKPTTTLIQDVTRTLDSGDSAGALALCREAEGRIAAGSFEPKVLQNAWRDLFKAYALAGDQVEAARILTLRMQAQVQFFAGPEPSGEKASQRFHAINVVWGETFLETYHKAALPTLLAEGNLKALAQGDGATYCLYTARSDAPALLESPLFAALRQVVPVRLVTFDDALLQTIGKFALMSMCHSHAVFLARAESANPVFLSPDAIFADNALAAVRRAFDAGKRAVMIISTRLDRGGMLAELARLQPSNGALAIAPRDMVAMSLRHPHPLMTSVSWDQERSCQRNCGIVWNVPNEGVLLRTSHWHPLAVAPELTNPVINSVLDADLLRHANITAEQLHVVTDSDELAHFELSDLGYGKEVIGAPGEMTAESVGSVVADTATPFHEDLLGYTARLHSGEYSPAWAAKQAESDAVVQDIFSVVRRLQAEKASKEAGHG